MSFGYKLVWMIHRYYLTFGKFNIPEIWFIVMTLIKITILLPNYFLVEMNTLYAVFILNSICSYWLNYVLGQRACVCLELPIKKVRMNKFLFIFQLTMFVLNIFLCPLYDGKKRFDWFATYDLILDCKTIIYRKYKLFLSV